VDFETDVFLSYAHIDNKRPMSDEDTSDGWVTDLHRALQNRLSQLLGQESHIWRDPKLQGDEVFADALIERLRCAATLVSVLSPAYVNSEWCEKELSEFCQCAESQGGLRIGDKLRLFKVIKTPVPLEQHPAVLQAVLGYEFFRKKPDTDKVEEFDRIFGKHAEIDFWIKLDDLAQDLSALLKRLGAVPAATKAPETSAPGAVYLALTPPDLSEERASIKRDLEQQGVTVLPGAPYAGDGPAFEAAIRRDLDRCRLSVHMIGRTYGDVPRGATRSLFEIQNVLAVERAARAGFARLIWMPPHLVPDDPRQQHVIEQLRLEPQMPQSTDLLETPLEDLKTVITAWLTGRPQPPAAAAASAAPAPATAGGQDYPQLYCVYDIKDVDAIAPWEKFLFNEFEVIRPVFTGDGADIRNAHEDSLRNCDGVLIFYGSGSEFWLRQKLREVQKSPGFGRTQPLPVVGVCLVPPDTPEKNRFATHDAIVVSQLSGFSPNLLQPFVARVKEARSSGRDNAGQTAV
jgi:hypothetical protein